MTNTAIMSYQEKGKVSPFVMFDTIIKSLLDFDDEFEHANNGDSRYYYLHKRHCHRCLNEYNNQQYQHQYHCSDEATRRDSLGSNHSGQVCVGARNLRRPSGCFGRRCPTAGRLYDQKYNWLNRTSNTVSHHSQDQSIGTSASSNGNWQSTKRTSKSPNHHTSTNGNKQQQMLTKRDKCSNDL